MQPYDKDHEVFIKCVICGTKKPNYLIFKVSKSQYAETGNLWRRGWVGEAG